MTGAPLVYVVVAGDMLAAFTSRETADLCEVGWIGANLDTARYRFTPERWAEVKARIATEVPDAEVVDTTEPDGEGQ